MNQRKSIIFIAKPLTLLGACLLWSAQGVFADNPLLIAGHTMQQQQEISGRITDDNGAAISGATVTVKGTNRATSSNESGVFSLQANLGEILEIRNLGFKTQEFTIQNTDQISITLLADNANIDEIVIVGYGTQKRSNITSAISTVNGDALKNISPSNLSNALAGRAPGVKVTGTSGMSGATSKIRFRGSFAEPLFVIDGIVRDKAAYDAL